MCFNVAINNDFSDSLFIGNGACGGLDSTMDIKHKIRFHSNNIDGYYVKCRPLSSIVKECNLQYIDLLSIDVEGAELIVLETIDFSVPIYVICIELDKNNEEKDQKCRDILLKMDLNLLIEQI
jgi:FkbM family methyltransferase